jgi:hypothetical protein
MLDQIRLLPISEHKRLIGLVIDTMVNDDIMPSSQRRITELRGLGKET